MNKEEVRLVVSYEINDFDLFRAVADECSRYVLENEEDTIAYDWYVADDKRSGKLLEVYRSKEALEVHMLGAVFKEIGLKFKKSITWVSVESFGELPGVFYKVLGAVPNANWATPEVSARK